MDMDCEPLSSTVVGDDDDDRDVAISRDDDDLPFEAITYVRLRDVIPCNLRSTHDFLQSSVNLAIETRYLETFAKCYGYLMYDRSRKLSTIRSTTTRARAIARWLSEIEDIDTFRRTLYDHLIQTRSLLRDDMIDALDLDDDIDDELKKHCNDGNDGNAGNGDFFENDLKTSKQTENSNFPKTKVYGRELLRLARDLLDQVLAFLRSEDHLRRAININGFFLRDLRRRLVASSSVRRERLERHYVARRERSSFDRVERRDIVDWSRNALVVTVFRTCFFTVHIFGQPNFRSRRFTICQK